MLGSLIEKERTVPDQYPLSLNSLVSACNQSTSRDPVMTLDDLQVQSALDSLKASGLLRFVHPSHGRSVTRFRHVADEVWQLTSVEVSLVAVLLLRGSQTSAEIRSRTERMGDVGSVADVEAVLVALADRGLVEHLSLAPGTKERRWCQLLAERSAEPEVRTDPYVAPRSVALTDVRVQQLEDRVTRIEALLADLFDQPPPAS